MFTEEDGITINIHYWQYYYQYSLLIVVPSSSVNMGRLKEIDFKLKEMLEFTQFCYF